MSKLTKKERISTLEDAVAMNWSDMKKIETKISRAMTDMATRISNISLQLEGQQRQIHLAADSIGLNKQAIIMLENEREAEPQPQLKQLDQSVFDNMHERWRFAAVDEDGSAHRFSKEVFPYRESFCYEGDDYNEFKFSLIGTGYDASNWQNSLIERDTEKELLEVDLSSELTGSDLAMAMLERGDKWVVCFVAYNEKNINYCDEPSIVVAHDENGFYVRDSYYSCAVPVNRKGEPLTASEVGL